jgi:hypothetical protein
VSPKNVVVAGRVAASDASEDEVVDVEVGVGAGV